MNAKENAVIINFIEQILRLNPVEQDDFNKYLNHKDYKEAKKMISGIAKGQTGIPSRNNPPTLWGPAIAEVRVWE